jgi:uncharacterized membrane protein YkvA (DUF1232 family)
MPYKISIELSDRDLRHFRRELRREREALAIADDEEILGAALEMIGTLRASDLPDFIRARIVQLETLVEMLQDLEWDLEAGERAPVLAALAYVCDPEDIIPDDLPGIGLLDDAVMIELVFRELRHELAAYEDFKSFRKQLPRVRAGARNANARAAQLARRRDQLMKRMRRRSAEDALLR